MSIINLEKTFENGQLIYFNIDNKIIECVCLSKLSKYSSINYDNEDLGTFACNKVKVITIYDIYKNIIYTPIQSDMFVKKIKICRIFKNLKKKDIFFFKTYTRAFIENNKLNSTRYHLEDGGSVENCSYNEILYNNISLYNKILYNNISLEILDNSEKIFNIYNNKGKIVHKFKYYKDLIIYKNYNDKIRYRIYNNYIKIIKGKFPSYQTIHCHIENLKIFKIYKYYKYIEDIYEKRNDNNEIICLIKYDNNRKIKEKFISNNTNLPFSKPLRNFCIELIDYYKKNINNYNELMNFLFKKDKIINYNLLLTYKLEIINST